MGYFSIGTWLRRSIDPLGPRTTRVPKFTLSPRQTRQLLRTAEAHHVLSTVLRNLPFPAQDPAFDQIRQEADCTRIAALALSAMLSQHAERILDKARGLPVTIVKGPTFARRIYPNAGLRPFTDLDLLVRPEASGQLDTVLRDQGFIAVKTGLEPARLETKWIHRGTGALVEVHTDLVHGRRMRAAFSLTYQDLEGQDQSQASMLAVAVTHGATHFFAWLRHVVDTCQAARALPPEEEAHFEALTLRTGTRFAAIVGLTLAYRVMGEPRCLDIAYALGPIRRAHIAKILSQGGALTATSNSWLLYNTWRRFLFRELLRYGALAQPRGAIMTDRRFAKNPNLFVEDMDEEMVLYEAGSHRAIYLNETATLVWRLCDGTRTVQELIEMLAENYPDARADLPRDIESAVEMLLREGALSPAT